MLGCCHITILRLSILQYYRTLFDYRTRSLPYLISREETGHARLLPSCVVLPEDVGEGGEEGTNVLLLARRPVAHLAFRLLDNQQFENSKV